MTSNAVNKKRIPDAVGDTATVDRAGLISLIISLYNCETSIKELHASLSTSMRNSNTRYEIIYVDDGSTDATYSLLNEIADTDDRVKIIKMRSSFGEASTFDAGVKRAAGDTIVYVTSRVRVAMEGILKLCQKLDDGYDMVVGWRFPRADSSLNQIISRLFNWLTRKMGGLNLHDINSGILVAKREVLENVPIYGSLNRFLPMLAHRQGYKVTEEKIEQLKGLFRQSRYLGEYLQRLLDILTVIFLTKYSKKPIHFLGFVGMLFAIVGIGTNAYLLVYRILGMGPIAGRPLLLVGALFLVIGIQMISIGLIGEMIIYTHARDIKEYNIEKIVE
ncbi:glycosyltransferase [candidate division KSB1 bacterium]|nr:glycosyltransferase [candidate division KSB1 bacterium]